jgi:hypothetical protein
LRTRIRAQNGSPTVHALEDRMTKLPPAIGAALVAATIALALVAHAAELVAWSSTADPNGKPSVADGAYIDPSGRPDVARSSSLDPNGSA